MPTDTSNSTTEATAPPALHEARHLCDLATTAYSARVLSDTARKRLRGANAIRSPRRSVGLSRSGKRSPRGRSVSTDVACLEASRHGLRMGHPARGEKIGPQAPDRSGLPVDEVTGKRPTSAPASESLDD